jgi:hypothetical protein
MNRQLAIVLVVALALTHGTKVHAQFAYPSGYGGYGWGGWGSTPQSALARGLGYFNMGRGAYNEQTAVAQSINADTLMRWNQYAYQSHLTASNNYAARLVAQHNRINRARAEIYDQLRTHPTTYDIVKGDALNLLLDTLTNPSSGGSTVSRIKTPLRHELIPQIPFAYASEGITVCLAQMTEYRDWPIALKVDDFKPERDELRRTVSAALERDKEGDLDPATIEAVQHAIDQLRLKFTKLVPPSNPDYVPAHDTIKALAGLTKMLYSPKVEEILAELEDYQGTTLGDLLCFMQAFNLRFGSANSFRQRQIYLKLYPMLAEQANGGASGAVATAGPLPASINGDIKEEASKAAAGLKSAAVDFFKGMDWKHLTGKQASPGS